MFACFVLPPPKRGKRTVVSLGDSCDHLIASALRSAAVGREMSRAMGLEVFACGYCGSFAPMVRNDNGWLSCQDCGGV